MYESDSRGAEMLIGSLFHFTGMSQPVFWEGLMEKGESDESVVPNELNELFGHATKPRILRRVSVYGCQHPVLLPRKRQLQRRELRERQYQQR